MSPEYGNLSLLTSRTHRSCQGPRHAIGTLLTFAYLAYHLRVHFAKTCPENGWIHLPPSSITWTMFGPQVIYPSTAGGISMDVIASHPERDSFGKTIAPGILNLWEMRPFSR